MRILLDENVPVDILPVLRGAGIEAESVNFIGWKRLQNGELVVRAREQLFRQQVFHRSGEGGSAGFGARG